MEIELNGEKQHFSGSLLTELLEKQALSSHRPFAVSINLKFIPKSRYSEIQLQEGDKIEIVQPVVGG